MSDPTETASIEAAAPRRCGFVAVIGAPNAGKSTLVNALVGAKVSIVSHKVQTTRMQIRGIFIEGAAQVVLVDTPGIFKPRRRLDRAMVDAAWGGASDGDLILLMIDAAKGICPDAEAILQRLDNVHNPRHLVLNKVDRIAKPVLLGLAQSLNERHPFASTHMISALTGDGIADLRRFLAAAMPEGPWHFGEDDISDMPQRMLAAELTRERIYHWLHDELPYATTVETTAWKELKDGSVRIEQTIFVERDSQRIIVLGAGGRTVRQISSESRAELARLIERPVHLFLFVKVRDRWGDDPERYRELGLPYPKDE